MTKATNIKNFIIRRFDLLPHHFEVNINEVSCDSMEHKEKVYRMNPLDITGVNRVFDIVHGTRVGEQWFSVSLIAKGVGTSLVEELNVFLEESGEEIIELENHKYSSKLDGLNDLIVEVNGNDCSISLAWKIEK